MTNKCIEQLHAKYNEIVTDMDAIVRLMDLVSENIVQCSTEDWILCLKLIGPQISEFAKFKIEYSLQQIMDYCENCPFDPQIKSGLLDTWFKSALINLGNREGLMKAFTNGYKSYINSDLEQIVYFNLVVDFINS